MNSRVVAAAVDQEAAKQIQVVASSSIGITV